MKINDIQVDGFGVWKGLNVENLNPGMTLFYGRNEAGKTTLMQFIRCGMFGFSSQRRAKYSPPVYGGLTGGEIHTISPEGNYLIQRHIDPNRIHDAVGDLVLTHDQDGSRHGKGKLSALLSHMDEAIFNNVFAIGLKEIQELSSLNSTEAADHLYKLTTGLDRVSLVDVMRKLKLEKEAIYNSQAEHESQLERLYAKRTELKQEIHELLAQSRHWAKISLQSKEAAEQIHEMERQLEELEREVKIVELATQVTDRWNQRELLGEQIRQIGVLPEAKLLQVEELDKLNDKITHQQEKMSSIKKQRQQIKREALGLPINRQLWAQAPRIEAMCEHLPWIESLERQLDRLKAQIRSIESTIGGEVSGIGSTLNLKTKDVRDLSNRGFQSLKEIAEQITQKDEEITSATETVEQTRSEMEHVDRRVQTASNQTGNGLTRDEAVQQVTRLRRRVELEGKIEKLNNARRGLEREIDDVVSDQVLPVGKLIAIGAVFIFGVVLAGFGLLSLSWTNGIAGTTVTEMGFLFMILGTTFGLFSMALKHHWERIARDELDDFRHQFDVVRQQLKRAKNERDEIEQHLPAGVGDWELQLKEAESYLTRLEDVLPLENHYQNSVIRFEEATRRLQRIESERKTLQVQWKDNLRAVGMPDSVIPSQLNDLTKRTERITGFHSRLEQLEGEVFERQKELEVLSQRIDTLFVETGLTQLFDADPATRIQKLQLALGKQRNLIGQRRELATKFRNLRSSYLKSDRELERLLGLKRRLLSAANADTDEDFRHLSFLLQQRQELTAKKEGLTDQISAALGTQFTEPQIADYLERLGPSGLEKRWEATQQAIDTIRQEQSLVHQKRGELLQEIRMLGDDSRLDEAKLELNAATLEIEQLQGQWQTLSMSLRLLDTIRTNYEAKRQPETLLEASQYLERLTDGHYPRIWTRLTGKELLVDNASGETLTVEHLSRGTREAVYLSLRLALVDAYSRRGTVLPLVLDDVLVNFDAERVRGAAEVLRDFAESGHQVLMFTCHDHIRDLFHTLDTEVLILPHHRDVVDHHAKPTRMERAEILAIETPEIVEAVTVTEPAPTVVLKTDEYDPDLAFELSAVSEDQLRENSVDDPLLRIDNQPNPQNLETVDVWDPGIDISAQRSA